MVLVHGVINLLERYLSILGVDYNRKQASTSNASGCRAQVEIVRLKSIHIVRSLADDNGDGVNVKQVL